MFLLTREFAQKHLKCYEGMFVLPLKYTIFILWSNQLLSFSLFFKSGPSNIFEAIERNDVEAVKRFLLTPDANLTIQGGKGRTPLHEACYRGCLEICNLLLSKGANKEAQDEDGRTSLHCACGKGNLSICTLLIEQGANLEVQDKDERTPVHIACLMDQLEVLRLLIKYGANKEAKDKGGNSPLHMASLFSPIMRKLLLKEGVTKDIRNNAGKTPLHLASESSRPELCEQLLEEGFDKEARDNEGNTPLHLASFLGLSTRNYLKAQDDANFSWVVLQLHMKTFVVLLKNAVNRDIQNAKGETPLHKACSSEGRYDICEVLLNEAVNLETRDNEGRTPLHIACFSFFEACKLLLKKGADTEACDNQGNTPLHTASERGYHDICKVLLDHSANKDAQNNHGSTPLHLASEQKHLDVCKLLVKKGAKINAVTKNRETPLMLACKGGQKDIIVLLLGQDKLLKELKDDVLEGTALHWACYYNHLECCQELVKAGFEVNETANSLSLLHLAVKSRNPNIAEMFLEKQSNRNLADKNGETALHWACEFGTYEITEKFVLKKTQFSIDLNAKNGTGKTPLHNAVMRNDQASVRLLLKYGALPNEPDNYNKTPIMYAAEKRYVEICKLIKNKISIPTFNDMKTYLGSLVRGNEELEILFGIRYQTIPLSNPQKDSEESEQEFVQNGTILQKVPCDNETIVASDNNLDDCIDQVSEDDQ